MKMKNLVFILVALFACHSSTEKQYQEALRLMGNNPAQAYQILLPLAEKGHAPSQLKLAFMLFRGNGVAVDSEQSLNWLKKCVAQGYVPAYEIMGSCYAYGEGCPRDDQEALKWFQKAVDGGDAHVQKIIDYYNKNHHFLGSL